MKYTAKKLLQGMYYYRGLVIDNGEETKVKSLAW